MINLTKIKPSFRRTIRRSKIEKLSKDIFGDNSPEFRRIMKACDYAVECYRGEKRKNGEARISHERRMFVRAIDCGIRDVDILVAIFLHDLHEDYPEEWPIDRLVRTFGGNPGKIVEAVTKPPLNGLDIKSLAYSRKVCRRIDSGGVKAWILKILDRDDFLNSLYDGPRDKIVWKLYQTMMIVIPKAAELNFLARELQIGTAKWIVHFKIKGEEAPWGRED